MLGLGATVTMAPLQASGRQQHGVAKIVTLIEHQDRVMRRRVPVSTSTYVGYVLLLRQVPTRLMELLME